CLKQIIITSIHRNLRNVATVKVGTNHQIQMTIIRFGAIDFNNLIQMIHHRKIYLNKAIMSNAIPYRVYDERLVVKNQTLSLRLEGDTLILVCGRGLSASRHHA